MAVGLGIGFQPVPAAGRMRGRLLLWMELRVRDHDENARASLRRLAIARRAPVAG